MATRLYPHNNYRIGIITLFVTTLFLSACGGGGGGGDGGEEGTNKDQEQNDSSNTSGTSNPNNTPGSTEPETTITSQPPTLSSKAINSFELSSTEQDASFEVSLDGAPFATVSNPYQTPELSDGSHALEVRAVASNGTPDPTPAQFAWEVDTQAPNTSIDQAPSGITSATTAEVSFSSTESNVSFEVSVDDQSFQSASSPFVMNDLQSGEHRIAIRAVDTAGNADATPASASWTVDTIAPDTLVSTSPPPQTNSVTGLFEFSSNEPNVRFEASLDGGAFSAATSPLTTQELAPGNHNIILRAIDQVGNVDPTPASVDWSIDTQAPDTELVTTPEDLSKNASGLFQFSSSEPNSSFEASIDGGAFTTVTSPYTTNPLLEGAHNILLRAIDQAGNVDPEPASFSWKIDATAPQVTVHFPTPSSLTDAASLTITGVASDTNAIKEIKVNGIVATTTNNFNSWQATATIQPGTNEVIITSEDEAGNLDNRAASVSVRGISQMLRTPDRIALHKNRNTLYIIDDKAVVAHNLTTGVKTILANDVAGSGPLLADPRGIAIDSTSDRILVTDNSLDALIAIDPDTGVRSIVSDSTTNNDNPFSFPRGIALDEASNIAYVIDSGLGALLAVNLSDGERTIVSSSSKGSGPDFSVPVDIALDKANSRILYTDLIKRKELHAIDIATGNRSTLSGDTTGSGQSLEFTSRVIVDSVTNQALVTDSSLDAIVAVSLQNGDRSILSGAAQVGPTLQRPMGITIDAATRQLFVADDRLNAMLSVDTNTGLRTLAPIDNIGSGPLLGFVKDLFFESSLNRITAVENDPYRVINIDTNTGARTQLVDNSIGSGPRIQSLSRISQGTTTNTILALGELTTDTLPRPKKLLTIDTISGVTAVQFQSFSDLGSDYKAPNQSGLVVDTTNNEALLFVPYTEQGSQPLVSMDSLAAVDLTQLTIREIAGAQNGSGPTPDNDSVIGVALHSANDTLYMVDRENGRIMSVSLPTGTRSVISDSSSNSATTDRIKLPEDITLNSNSTTAYVSDIQQDAIFSVDLNTATPGKQHLVSGLGAGTGPLIQSITGLSSHTNDGVLFFYETESNSIMAVETGSGDRVIISR